MSTHLHDDATDHHRDARQRDDENSYGQHKQELTGSPRLKHSKHMYTATLMHSNQNCCQFDSPFDVILRNVFVTDEQHRDVTRLHRTLHCLRGTSIGLMGRRRCAFNVAYVTL